MQRVTSKSSASSAAVARTLLSAEQNGRIFTRRMQSRVVPVLMRAKSQMQFYPLIRAGQLYQGGCDTASGSAHVSFSRGQVRGHKRVSTVPMAGSIVRVAHTRIAFDTFRDEPYFFVNDCSLRTPGGISGAVTGTLLGFAWHDGFAKSYVVRADKTIVYASDSRAAHVNATLPSLVGVAFGTTAVIGMTPTHILVPTGDIRHGTNGFLRSSDGVNFSLIGGITAIVDLPTIQYAEYIDGRLYLGTNKGLWSTGDNGATWRMDIAQNVSITFVSRRANGGILAVGNGFWHAPPAGGFTKVGTLDLNTVPLIHIAEQRLVYADTVIYSESGVALLEASSFDANTDRVAGFGSSAGYTFAPIQFVPDGDSSIVIMVRTSSNGGENFFVRQDFGLYVPPETGAEVEIIACGSGGTIGATGRDTTVSNLMLAAGGAPGTVSAFDLAVGTPGQLPMPKVIAGAGDASFIGVATYEAKGGPGLVISGREFGQGQTAEFLVTLSGTLASPTYITGSASTRGGSSAPPLIWRGRVSDPIPMAIASAIENFPGNPGRSGVGVVAIAEVG